LGGTDRVDILPEAAFFFAGDPGDVHGIEFKEVVVQQFEQQVFSAVRLVVLHAYIPADVQYFFDEKIVELLNIWTGAPHLEKWQKMVTKTKEPKTATTIAIVGKYVNLIDSYKSLNEALVHGGIANDCRVNLNHVDSELLERQGPSALLQGANGILVPGGFGDRGIEGKIQAITYARENRVPYFGICLGMQLSVIEFARNVCGLKKAHSSEFHPTTPDPVIYLLKEWVDYKNNSVQKRDEHSHLGGTMRLGDYPCVIQKETLSYQAYQTDLIHERHRHRYEFNVAYKDQLVREGMIIGGQSPDEALIEIIEIAGHPWFLGCQFHPEFKSRPMDPHPLFREFIKASLAFRP
jgi:CTP synthase